MKKIKKDIILILAFFSIAALLWIVPVLQNKLNDGERSAVVRIYQEGQEIDSYLLSEDVTVPVPYEKEGGYNLLLIENGRAFISDADCPDMLCVKQRSIARNGESIICLPHKLVVQIESKEESGLDAITY